MKHLLAFTAFLFLSHSLFSQSFQSGDRITVFDEKKQKDFSATILKLESSGYLVHYDGYSDQYNEIIPFEKAKPMKEIPGVAFIKSEKKKKISVLGNLKSGKVLDDLSWAESSSMACWPGTRHYEFEGKMVFFWTDLPKRSVLSISVTPKDSKKRINLFAYSGFSPDEIPPQVSGAVSCEASYQSYNGEPDLTKPNTSKSVELRAINNPYRVFIGVSGAQGVEDGDFELQMDLK